MDMNSKMKQLIDTANRSDIGRKTGMSLSGVSRILSGHRNPSAKALEAIAGYLRVGMNDLYAYLKLVQAGRKGGKRKAA